MGVVNQKRQDVEAVDEVLARARRAIDLIGAERVLLSPDCGFASFEAKLASGRASLTAPSP